MSIRHALLGTTILTGLALVEAANFAPARAADLIVNTGVAESIDGQTQSYDNVRVGVSAPNNQLEIKGGSEVNAKAADIGAGADADGNLIELSDASQLVISGAGSGEGFLTIGNAGSYNTLRLNGGSSVSVSKDLVLAQSTDSSGNEVIIDNSTLTAINILVGNSGSGNTADVMAGGLMRAELSLIVGANSDRNVVNVDGVSADGVRSRIQSEGLTVGESGSENGLTITNGGSVVSGNGYIGRSSNDNFVSVSGGATGPDGLISSEWRIEGDTPFLMIGQRGNGNTLLVSEGGRVTVDGEILLGGSPAAEEDTGSGNLMRITGAGSSVSAAALRVGERGNDNAVVVENSGVLTTADTWIGYSGNSGNRVRVAGNGLWTVNGDLLISATSIATGSPEEGKRNELIIQNGGKVDVSGGVQNFANGYIEVGSGSTLTAGHLALYAGSLVSVYVDDEAPSKIEVEGLASLDGDLVANIGAQELQKNRYTVLTAGDVTGEFNSLTLQTVVKNLIAKGALEAELVYTDTGVYIQFESDIGGNLGEGQSLSRNQSNIADAINTYYNKGGELPLDFVTLFGLSGTGALNALSEMSGEVGASGGAQSIMRANTLLLDQMTDAGLENRQNGLMAAAGPGGSVVMPTADVPSGGGWSAWGSAIGATSDTPGDNRNGSHDTSSNLMGLATGWDMEISPDSRLGFAIGAGVTDWDLDSGLGTGSSNYLSLGAYGAQHFGATYVSAAGSFGWHSMETDRKIGTAGSERLEADFNATTLSGRFEVGHRLFAAHEVGLSPYGALQAQAVYMPDYEEEAASGKGSYALSYDSNTATAVRGELGVRLDADFGSTPGAARAFGKLAWAHDWMSDPSVNASFLSIPAVGFTVYGAEAPENLALASLGVEAALSEATSFSASFDGEFGQDYSSLAGTLALRVSW